MKFIENYKKKNKSKSNHKINAELLEELAFEAKTDDIAIASAVLIDENKHSDNSMTSEQEEKNTNESIKLTELVRVLLKNLSNNINTANTANNVKTANTANINI